MIQIKNKIVTVKKNAEECKKARILPTRYDTNGVHNTQQMYFFSFFTSYFYIQDMGKKCNFKIASKENPIDD